MAVDRQYASAAPFFGPADSNVVSDLDKQRLQAYDFYEDAYHNRPEAFKLTIRGADGDATEIHLPEARKIVEATNRFLAVKFNFVVDPSSGTPDERAQVARYVKNLFRREKVHGKFANNKRYGLIRGDSLFHITADDTKPEGKRISVHELHPRNYFPIEDPNNPDRLLGCHIVDVVPHPTKADDQVARRQTYRRVLDVAGNPTGVITSELTLWELGTWDDRNLEQKDMKLVGTPSPLRELPADITSLPVYHVRNNALPGKVFGLSQISGIESLINGMNQSITDEDLTLVMQGLGMYWTNAGAPRNVDGSPAPWNLGPGQVVEVGDGQQFGRVTGVSSVAPMQEHMKFLDDAAMQGLGIPALAAGTIDVQVAESGISRLLQMAPIIAQNQEKEVEILLVHDHMLYDLVQMWMPAYEGIEAPDVEVTSVVDDPMPKDRDAVIQEVLLLFTGGVLTMEMVHAKLTEFGYDFQPGDVNKILEEQRSLAVARNGDPFDNRWGEDVESTAGGSPSSTDAPSTG